MRINAFLIALVSVVATGCQTAGSQQKNLALIEFHIEANTEEAMHTEKIAINRSDPVELIVNAEPFLDTRYLTNAAVVEVPGGYSLQLDFDPQGAWRLESATSLYSGKRIAVLAMFPEKRWLAAPLPRRRISNGRLTFTPDCTREEADRIVAGLHRAIAKFNK